MPGEMSLMLMSCCFSGILLQISQGFPTAKPPVTKPLEWNKGHSEVVYPRLHIPENPRQKSSSSFGDPVLVLRTPQETFYIELKPNQGLLKLNASSDEIPPTTCHYHGSVLSHEDGVAAISICESPSRITGTIIIQKNAFILRPLDHLERNEIHSKFQNVSQITGIDPHVISKVEDSVTPFCGVDTSENFPQSVDNDVSHSGRYRRSDAGRDRRLGGNKVIETAIFVDNALYKKFIVERKKTLSDLRETILAIINQVQVIYNYKSLNQKFKIVIVKIEYLTEKKDAPDTANGNIDDYLENFCEWQSPKNPPKPSPHHWDHAIMLSGYDLYHILDDGEKNYKVLGLAWVSGMCRARRSCTLNEGSSFEGSFVIAHEMGHSLGIMHDGVGNECDPSTYIMAGNTGAGRITWSECSRDYLDKFFLKGKGHCLEDDDSNEVETIQYKYDDHLPGYRFDLDEQCKLSHGKNYRAHVLPKAPFDNVCRQLWCISGVWASMAHPALEGSSCGDGKYCIQGKCTGKRPHSSAKNEGDPSSADLPKLLLDFMDKLRLALRLILP